MIGIIVYYCTFVYTFSKLDLPITKIDKKVVENVISDRSDFLEVFVGHTLKTFRRSSKVIVKTFLTFTIIFLAGTLFLDLFLIQSYYTGDSIFFNMSLIVSNILIMVVLFYGFLYPQLVPKNMLLNEKERLLSMVESNISIRLEAYLSEEITLESEKTKQELADELNFLHNQSERIEKAIIWPFDYRQMVTLVFSSLIPLTLSFWPLLTML